MKPGDLVVSTQTCYFDYSEEVKKKHLYSQKPGDIIMINRLYEDGHVHGTGVTGIAYNGRHCAGLGGSFKPGTYRLANPDDPGFIGPRETWELWSKQKQGDLLFNRVVLWVIIAMSLWVILSK
jgi:hypothetical protein